MALDGKDSTTQESGAGHLDELYCIIRYGAVARCQGHLIYLLWGRWIFRLDGMHFDGI